MGHSCQAISLLLQAVGSFFAVPLATRIHEGVKKTNRDKRTLLDKLLELLQELALSNGFYLVADAYYASKDFISGLGAHLISRVKSNAVAYEPAPLKIKRPRKTQAVWKEDRFVEVILIVVEFSGWRSGGFNPSAETLETSAPVDGLCGTFI
jgi:hypothetical protein